VHYTQRRTAERQLCLSLSHGSPDSGMTLFPWAELRAMAGES
jgi:hypothetical protein